MEIYHPHACVPESGAHGRSNKQDSSRENAI